MKKTAVMLTALFLLAGCYGQGSAAEPSASSSEPLPVTPEPVPEDAPLLVKEEYRDAQVSYTRTYTYDEDGNITHTSFSASTGETEETDWFYEGGKLIRKDVQAEGGYTEGNHSASYTYEEDGTYTVKDVYEFGGITEIFTYDEYDHELKMISAYDGGEFVQENRYELTSDGKVLHVVTLANDEFMNETYYEYNDRGEVISMKGIVDGGEELGEIINETVYTYTYDSDGNIKTMTQYDPSDEENTKIVTEYTYNRYRQITKEVSTDPYGNTVTKTCTYQ